MFTSRHRIRMLEIKLDGLEAENQRQKDRIWALQGQLDLIKKHLGVEVVQLHGMELRKING